MEVIIDWWQYFYYGVLGRAPKVDLSVVPSSFGLNPHYDEVNEVYWVDSNELPDFEATGKTLEELAENIQETLYVYCDVPRYFARRHNAHSNLNIKDPRTGEARSIVVQRKQLERALAGA